MNKLVALLLAIALGAGGCAHGKGSSGSHGDAKGALVLGLFAAAAVAGLFYAASKSSDCQDPYGRCHSMPDPLPEGVR